MTRAAMGAVVTGGGSGIGRALARRLAAGGARVVVNDIDPGAAKAVADEIGGLAAPADVATRDGVAGLVAAARDYLGEIDLYCSNAGIAAAGDVNDEGPAAAEADWQRSWDVNVMAHVRAAEQLLPGWLARGDGRLVITASATASGSIADSRSTTSPARPASDSMFVRTPCGHRQCTLRPRCP